jgi:DNA gyrase subunit A
VAATLVDTTDEIMLITTGGVLIRTRVAEIREMGRATQGVTLIAVEDGTKLSGLQRIVETDVEDVIYETEHGVVVDVNTDAQSDEGNGQEDAAE